MSSTPAALVSWRPRATWAAVALVFLLQVGLIFWLGEKTPLPVRTASLVPTLELGTNSNSNSEFLALNDPTLFALPHKESFSGMAWLKTYKPGPVTFDWPEAPQLLALPTESLGTMGSRIAETGRAAGWDNSTFAQPRLTSPGGSWPSIDQASTLEVDGELAQWALRKPLELRAWPARRGSATDAELLTNTVIQLLVDGLGEPVSATLLASSGDASADQFALSQGRGARFVPPGGLGKETATNGLAGLRWGRLIFRWHTVAATNAPTAP